jgi:hypothetical protein
MPAARAVRFFVPGVPQVCYLGLRAACNDMARRTRPSVGRDIDRRRFRAQAVDLRAFDTHLELSNTAIPQALLGALRVG